MCVPSSKKDHSFASRWGERPPVARPRRGLGAPQQPRQLGRSSLHRKLRVGILPGKRVQHGQDDALDDRIGFHEPAEHGASADIGLATVEIDGRQQDQQHVGRPRDANPHRIGRSDDRLTRSRPVRIVSSRPNAIARSTFVKGWRRRRPGRPCRRCRPQCRGAATSGPRGGFPFRTRARMLERP